MSNPLNIGVVANTAFNIYNFRLSLIKALINEGHHVIAIAPKDEYIELLKENNIEFIEVKNLARKGTNPINDLKLLNEFRKIYKQQRLDVVLQYTIKPNIYGTLAARFSGTKTICTVTGLGFTFLNNSFASKVAHTLYKLAFSFADKVLFQNTDDLNIFVEYKLVKNAKTQIVPGSGINVQKFNPQFCTEKKTDGVVRFLMIARVLKDKGIYEYVAAARHLLKEYTNVEFHLLGEIDNDNPSAIGKAELESWVKEGVIKYHGHTKDTRPYICETDCVVLPSYREGMPRAILESMAMAKVSITTNAPGCRDAVQHMQSGIICKTADSAALIAALKTFILLDESVKNQISVNAKNRAESIFSTKAVNLIYINLLRNL